MYITLHVTCSMNKLSSRFAMLATWHSYERNVTLNYVQMKVVYKHPSLLIDPQPQVSYMQKCPLAASFALN